MNEWLGRNLGRVRVESLIARGGMAEVYFGMHTTLEREVAVKIMRNQYEDDEELLERFQREARVVAKLRHQNIVQVFDYDVIDEHPFIVMEYVAGPSLSKYLSILHKNGQLLDLKHVNKIISGVAYALQYAHETGVVHRDIKPGNIILTSRTQEIIPGEPLPEDFVPVLTDFGLVRFLDSARQTSAGQTAGTPAYMSPEQARGEITDGRTDIYSLGVVLYEMLSGRTPFDGETTMSILLKHITDPPLPIQGLSKPMQRILDKALAKDKEDRFQKPNDFAQAFDVAVNEETEQSTYMGMMSVAEPSALAPVSRPISRPIIGEPVDSRVVVNPPKKPLRWIFPVLAGVALAALGLFFYRSNTLSAPQPSETSTLTPQPIATTQRPIIPLSGTLGSTAVLHFRDGDMIMDQAALEALALPAPANGGQYEVWLGNAEGLLDLGALSVDANGKGLLTYNAENNEDLLSIYDHVELTVKVNDVNQVAYAYTLPADGLIYLRQLLVSSSDTPDQTALIQGLASATSALEENTKGMLNALSNNDQTTIKHSAETMINIIVGDQSPDYKDWNGDSKISDTSKGYGFVLNGNNAGYIQAVFAHADYAANSQGASQNMITHGAEVKACAENLSQWIPQLRDDVQKILGAGSLADLQKPVQDTADLIDQIQNGIDLNGNGKIDPITGECGMKGLYTSAYAMADMPLLPINLIGTPTATTGTPSPVGTIFYVTTTPANGSGSGNGANTPIPTQKNNNAGGNGGGNGGGNSGGNGNGNGGGNGGGNGNGKGNNP